MKQAALVFAYGLSLSCSMRNITASSRINLRQINYFILSYQFTNSPQHSATIILPLIMANTKYAYVRNFELPDPLLPGTFPVLRLDGHSFHRWAS